MSISQFQNLSEEQQQLLKNIPAFVTVLIAGADDEIDHNETGWATKLVKYRTFTAEPELHSYYEAVNESFEEALATVVAAFEGGKDGNGEAISNILASSSSLLAELDADFASLLLKSWKSLAKKVAEASGGFLGYASINTQEKELIDLPMIDFAS